MPPKKATDEKKILLGRPGNNLKSGIVGLANVGKSTLFNAITKSHLANAANFPYATTIPEESRVLVPDARFDWLCEKYKPKSQKPAFLTIYDIAGLTRGSSTGLGMGNAFLSHISAVDAIFQVVRCFDDAEIIHVEGDVNPTRDLDIIADELRCKDIESVERALENQKKKTRQGGQSLEAKKAREEEATIEKILVWLSGGVSSGHEVIRVKKRASADGGGIVGTTVPFSVSAGETVRLNTNADEADVPEGEEAVEVPDKDKTVTFALNEGKSIQFKFQAKSAPGYKFVPGKDVRKGNWTVKEVEFINTLYLLTAKPVVFLVNLSEKDFIRKKNKHLPKILEWVKENAPGDPIIPISCAFEEKLNDLEDEAAAKEECKRLGADSALPKVILQMRKALNLSSFFTCGEDEVRQWTIRTGTKAPQAAGVIHTDFEKTFIQAIVYNFEVLKELGDEAEVRTKGKMMTKGKDYVVEDGDIMEVKSGAGKKKK